MSHYAFNPDGLLPPSPTYSYGAEAAGLIFTAGIVAINAQGQTQHPENAGAQTEYVLDVIGNILKVKSSGFEDVLMVHVYLKSMADYPAMNQSYVRYFSHKPPPRFCIETGLVRDDWLVEIAVVAKSGQGET